VHSDAVERGIDRSFTYCSYQDQISDWSIGQLNAVDGLEGPTAKETKAALTSSVIFRQCHKVQESKQCVGDAHSPIQPWKKHGNLIDTQGIAGSHNTNFLFSSL